MCENVRKHIEQGPLSMNLGGWLIWVSLMECLDHIGCIHKVFGWFLLNLRHKFQSLTRKTEVSPIETLKLYTKLRMIETEH